MSYIELKRLKKSNKTKKREYRKRKEHQSDVYRNKEQVSVDWITELMKPGCYKVMSEQKERKIEHGMHRTKRNT